MLSNSAYKNNGFEKPILRWAGGKTWLLKKLHLFLPSKFSNYHEPFVGGGSVFFNLQPKNKSYLSDSNSDLINAYTQIRDEFDYLIQLLNQFHNTEEEYYRVRDYRFTSSVEKAAQFIYLNRTCFNGLYRVNLKGEFNVPYGFKSYKRLFDFDRLKRFSELLKPAIVTCCDFEESLQHIKKDDLVFLDPPYTVTHIKNGFIKYNERLFSWDDQERLAIFIEKIRSRGAYYILTNAKHDSIESLFGRMDAPVSVTRASLIGGKKARRGFIEEYVFTNVLRR
ncbi:MAG: Dam family site-specific DNA-(adenine-N6)-methyltransferase [bacterium]|nr:Dam family site-specific DNA-(adenine-N6)-methyltransferase [bacterium]